MSHEQQVASAQEQLAQQQGQRQAGSNPQYIQPGHAYQPSDIDTQILAELAMIRLQVNRILKILTNDQLPPQKR